MSIAQVVNKIIKIYLIFILKRLISVAIILLRRRSTVESIKKTVCENLKSVCKAKKIKNKDIAQAIGVSESCVSNWLRGKNSFDIDNLYLICRQLDISLDQAFGVAPIIVGALTKHENDVLVAYRSADPGTQANIRKLLDIPEEKNDSSASVI